MMYKMMTIDIDGTLINSENKITDEVKQAIKEASEKGVRIVLMTGRPRNGIAQFLAQLDIGDGAKYAASYNGAMVENIDTGELLVNHSLTYGDLKKLCALGESVNTQLHFLSEDKVFTPNREISKYTMHEAMTNDIPLIVKDVAEVDPKTIIEKVMFTAEPDDLTEIIKRVPEEIYETYNVVRSASYYLEILNKEADKGHALREMAGYFGIGLDEVVAIGDGGNDVGMIQEAGLGIAMGNAMEEVKGLADVVTKTNDEHGVAHAIRRWVL